MSPLVFYHAEQLSCAYILCGYLNAHGGQNRSSTEGPGLRMELSSALGQWRRIGASQQVDDGTESRFLTCKVPCFMVCSVASISKATNLSWLSGSTVNTFVSAGTLFL